MAKRRDIPVKLILTGELVFHLHYGVNARKWWEKQTIENTPGVNFLIPIRVGMKTQVELNDRVFTIQVTENFGSPGYVCQSEQLSSDIENSPTQAICKLYRQIFKNSTRYSGNLVFGLENKDITDQLLVDIPFRPFTIQVDKFSIIIYSLGVSAKEGYLGAGPGYTSSFIHKYSQKRCLFIQKIRESDCIIQMWYENVQLFEYVGNTPVEVWSKTKMLEKFCGTSLFGLEHPTTQCLLKQLQVPTCKPDQWSNKSVMTSLYDYHLKRRTIRTVDWLQFFTSWSNRKSNIIELTMSLRSMYPEKHVFNERELQAWNSMLKAAGCTDITPFDSDISSASYNL